jgi:hypothetical protein
MNRVEQIAKELIRLYREQLNVWALDRLAELDDVDLWEYGQRQERIHELCTEMKLHV